MLLYELNRPSASSLGPIDITTLRKRFRAPFKYNVQQDADEFLTYILDYLETKCGYKPFTAWLDILQGGVTSSIKCEKCVNVTSTVDSFTPPNLE